jgi:hypothetical protein
MSGTVPLRTDARRALALLLEGGRWIRISVDQVGRRRAGVQLSAYRGDAIPVGADVLDLLVSQGLVVAGRRLPGGDRRFVLTAGGRAALQTPPSGTPRRTAGRTGRVARG